METYMEVHKLYISNFASYDVNGGVTRTRPYIPMQRFRHIALQCFQIFNIFYFIQKHYFIVAIKLLLLLILVPKKGWPCHTCLSGALDCEDCVIYFCVKNMKCVSLFHIIIIYHIHVKLNY